MKRDINKILLLVILSLMISCSKDRGFEIENLNHNTIMVLGHRGMGELYKYPGNTVEAVLPVLGIGADGAELDIQMTKDSVLVLFHNDVLDDRTTGTGRIVDHNWIDIKPIRYRNTIAVVPICTVDSLFNLISNIETYYFSFDCKLSKNVTGFDDYQATFLRSIKRICQKYNMENNIIIEGGLDFLLSARKHGFQNKVCITGQRTVEESIDLAVNNDFFCIGASINITEEQVTLAHKNGIRVMIWSLKNSFGNFDAINKNVDIIQTDAPIHVLKQLNRYNYEYRIP